MCRAAAILAFAAGMVLTYMDSQTAVERQVTLRMPMPEPVALERIEPAGGLVDEVQVVARLAWSDPVAVTHRDGLSSVEYLALPLAPSDAGTGVAGYAIVPAVAAAVLEGLTPDASGRVVLHGLLGASSALDADVRTAMGKAGHALPGDAVALRLFTAPRDVVLSRPLYNAWRSVAFWAAACFLVAAYVLQSEQRRQLGASGGAAARAATEATVVPRRPPQSAKARARFHPIEDTPEAAPSQVNARPASPAARLKVLRHR